MQKYKLLFFLLPMVIFLLATNPVLASNPQKPDIEKLIKQVGIDQALQDVENDFRLQLLKERISRATNRFNEKEFKIFLGPLSAKEISDKVIERIAKELTSEQITQLNILFDKAVFKKLINKEQELRNSSELDIQQSILDSEQEVFSPNYLDLIEDIVDASLIVQQKAFLTATVLRERSKAPLEELGKFSEEEAQKLEYNINAYKDRIYTSMRSEIVVLYAIKLKSFSLAELQEILDILNNAHRTSLMYMVMDTLGLEISSRLNKSIKAVMQTRKTKGEGI
ncbi:MAG: hypothetical protein OEX00_11280 [Gammaproteobacteria bacterium]|nr:hypothetical protein [Gammaproteobacteria bacterium]MDH5693002.1 hypothetical protein [Gammaproteobacteria bacterium]